MTARSSFAKREKSLAEQVITVLMVAALMASFVFYFFKEEAEITQVGFSSLASKFASQVTAIKAQWYMDGQPKMVYVKTADSNDEPLLVKVNRSGWLHAQDSDNTCRVIWQWAMQTPLSFMKQPISVYSITDNSNQSVNHCRYSLPSGEFFEYWPKTGKVSQVKRAN